MSQKNLSILNNYKNKCAEEIKKLKDNVSLKDATHVGSFSFIHATSTGLVCGLSSKKSHTPSMDSDLEIDFEVVPEGLSHRVNLDMPEEFKSKIFELTKRKVGKNPTRTHHVIQASEKADENVASENDNEFDKILDAKDKEIKIPFSIGQKDIPSSQFYILEAEDRIPADFDIIVGNRFKSFFPFTLDIFQKQAIYHLEKNESVFVAAHTSSGKTAIAEYAINLSLLHMTKTIYTSPIKALSNQKFRDFSDSFGIDNVGLITGDVQINEEASCLIMTTEILRSMLYRSADIINDIEFVIFDEVHYVNDQERGVIWEEVIILLPIHVTIILLSATTPNASEFADWVGRTKNRNIHVIKTAKRPVPLEHYLYKDKETIKIVDQENSFLDSNFSNFSKTKKEKSLSNSSGFKGIRQEKTLWSHLISNVKKKNLLPAIVFTLSKRKCEENIDSLSNFDLTSSSEKSYIHLFLESSIRKLSPCDRGLPQITRMRDCLKRGIAVHHSGILPILKECVEILFSKGFIKVLFATETFAMGINMPARTVIFSSIRKHDGRNFRNLQSGEYTQMAGRAGRRGKDLTGTVIIVSPKEKPLSALELKSMIQGVPSKLSSQFRLTYSMILNLLRVESLAIEDMIKCSFSENSSQSLLPERQNQVKSLQLELSKLSDINCKKCSGEIPDLYFISSTILKNCNAINNYILQNQKMSAKYFCPGRIIILNTNIPALILDTTKEFKVSCMIILNVADNEKPSFFKPFSNTIDFPDFDRKIVNKSIFVDASQIFIITNTIIDISQSDYSQIVDIFTKALLEKEINSSSVKYENMKSLNIDEKIMDQKSKFVELGLYDFDSCSDHIENWHIYCNRRKLMDELANIQFDLSDSNLSLLPEYHSRLDMLTNLEYIDMSGNVTLKGRVACEINTIHEIIGTELLFSNSFETMGSPEILAILSCLVFQEKSQELDLESVFRRHPSLKDSFLILEELFSRICSIQSTFKISTFRDHLEPSILEVVYCWANGESFAEIMQLTDILEGSIVRAIVRLDETCREIQSAAKIMGDPVVLEKMIEAGRKIKRDICFTSSLYL